MHVSRSRDYQEWIWNVGLAHDETVTVPIGSQSGTQTVGKVISMPFVRFGFWAHRNATIQFELSMDNTNWVVVSALAVVGGVWADAYTMGAPYDVTGYWMASWALLRIKLVETSGQDHTYTRFQAIAYTN
jgi:hypothetical protein